VRCFEDDNIAHVSGRVDPESDMEIINTELMLADLATVERVLDRAEKGSKAGDKEQIRLRDLYRRVGEHLGDGKPVRTLGLSADEKKTVRQLFLLTFKPVVYIANVAEDGFDNNPRLEAVQALAELEGSKVVPICAAAEADLAELDEEDKVEFLHELGQDEPGLDRMIRAGYELLGLLTFFTAGPKEARAWTVRQGSTAPRAAGVIHTDFERGFIRAEVIAYDDYVSLNGEQGAKEAGKMRLEGKDYVMQDGDVVHFRFNV
jgi:hypothetical protein